MVFSGRIARAPRWPCTRIFAETDVGIRAISSRQAGSSRRIWLALVSRLFRRGGWLGEGFAGVRVFGFAKLVNHRCRRIVKIGFFARFRRSRLHGLRGRFRDLWRRRIRRGLHLCFGLRLNQRPRHFTLAAIAAALAPLAPVILARVLGTKHADLVGRLPADAARKTRYHRRNHLSVFLPRWTGAGCFRIVPRQRCASRSATTNSCSFWVARS